MTYGVFLISFFSMSSPVLSGFLGLPFSDLQPENRGLSYTLVHAAFSGTFLKGHVVGEQRRKASRACLAILGSQLPRSERKAPLFCSLCPQVLIATTGAVATVTPAGLPGN